MSVELTAAWWGTEEGVQGVDVLDHLKNLQTAGVESIRVDTDFYCDPQFGTAKILFVTYVIDGQTKKLEVRDYDWFKFADLA